MGVISVPCVQRFTEGQGRRHRERRDDIGDAVEWQRRERASWTRPWDDDYEEVRAESPDMFDEYDDKERAHYLALTKKAAAKHKKNAA